MQLSQGSVSTFNRALSPMMVSSFGQSLYREPLRLRAGVTSSQHGIRPVSPGITPALSLLRAHAPNLNPLTASVLPLYRESLQVAARPCWTQALPSVISANLSPDACTHTPVVLLVLLPVSSQETSAFVKWGPTRQLNNKSVQRLPYGPGSRGYSDFVMFRPPGLLATQIAPTTMCLSTLGSRGFYVPAYLGLSPPRAGDMLAARIGQLTAWGLSPH
jgi:hypothetical protein